MQDEKFTDTIPGTFAVAGALCVVCSLLVSTLAVGLIPYKEANKKLAIQREVVSVSGLMDAEQLGSASADDITTMFKSKVRKQLIDLSTGEVVDAESVGIDLESYKGDESASKEGMGAPIPAEQDLAQITNKETYGAVFQILDKEGEEEKLTQIVLPIRGKGLWSTLKGFIALQMDASTVNGITYYEHGETPGLGGEVDNKNWKAKWVGKTVRNDQGEVVISVIKGTVEPSTPDAGQKIDGLAGATITSRGVESMLHFWLGENGYGPYLSTLGHGSESHDSESPAKDEQSHAEHKEGKDAH